jgi:isoprenylcysteine carboxyl methyltransferase (ICMT) family protein YpbQ
MTTKETSTTKTKDGDDDDVPVEETTPLLVSLMSTSPIQQSEEEIRQEAIKKWFKYYNLLFIDYVVLLFGPICVLNRPNWIVGLAWIRPWVYIAVWTLLHITVNGTMAFKYPALYIMRTESIFVNDGPKYGNIASAFISIALPLTFLAAPITYWYTQKQQQQQDEEDEKGVDTNDQDTMIKDMVMFLVSLVALVVHCLGYIIIHLVPIQNRYAQMHLSPQQPEEQQIVMSGLYSCVRHPMYAGLYMWQIGFAGFFESWLSLSVVVLLGIGLTIRIYLEEEQLLEKFPEQYSTYMEQVPYRLVPGLC